MVLVLDGALHKLPFEALLLRSGEAVVRSRRTAAAGLRAVGGDPDRACRPTSRGAGWAAFVIDGGRSGLSGGSQAETPGPGPPGSSAPSSVAPVQFQARALAAHREGVHPHQPLLRRPAGASPPAWGQAPNRRWFGRCPAGMSFTSPLMASRTYASATSSGHRHADAAVPGKESPEDDGFLRCTRSTCLPWTGASWPCSAPASRTSARRRRSGGRRHPGRRLPDRGRSPRGGQPLGRRRTPRPC